MKPNYLFLDIDGVLNCCSDAEQLFLSEIEKKSNPNFKIYKSADFVVDKLNDLVQTTGTEEKEYKQEFENYLHKFYSEMGWK
mgnify:CR=1 FL=1